MSELSIRRLDTESATFEDQFNALLKWSDREDPDIAFKAREIVEDVHIRGDAALIEYTNQLDHRDLTSPDQMRISRKSMQESWHRLSEQTQTMLKTAAARIRDFHNHHSSEETDFGDELGNRLATRVTPLKRVGVYVPGGQASYPSTILMTVIPAQVANVSEIVVVVPMPQNLLSDAILGTLHLVDVNEAYSVGGAQAISALAYGTVTIQPVDKIVGPGGSWVAAAKKQVFGPVGIESLAGPSEILVIADESIDPKWVAWDLMSQAEHDESAQSILLSTESEFLNLVEQQITFNLQSTPRTEIIKKSLTNRGAFIRCRSILEGIEIANRIAPEHLQLAIKNPRDVLDRVTNAGAIFLGAYSAEALGDYVAGPSHVLPTFGTARYASVLGVQDFQKRSSVIEISESGGQILSKVAGGLAELEGLHAHAQAARVRIDDYDHNQ